MSLQIEPCDRCSKPFIVEVEMEIDDRESAGNVLLCSECVDHHGMPAAG